MNKKTVALTPEQYRIIVETIKSGFSYAGREYKPNERIAAALMMQANLGLRIGDVVRLKACDIVKDGDRFRLDIVEQKTGKARYFTVPAPLVEFIEEYRKRANMGEFQRLFAVSDRQIQKHLAAACAFLNLNGISTHSFRKFFATEIYINSGYNVELVRQLLQHSSAAVTARYIGIQQKEIEKALNGHICIF